LRRGFSLNVSDKLRYFTESPIREMTRLSEEHGAINLAQGMPDFDPPRELIDAAVEAIRHGSNQYPITSGQPNLREAIVRKVKEYNGIDANAEENVTVTCGSTEAVASAMFALTDPHDLVVLTDPFYENYVPNAVLAQCELNYVPFTGPSLTLGEESLKHAMEKRPKLIVLNTPNNPTGRVLDLDQLKIIADLCEDHGTIAITDEIYEHIVYDGKRHISLATVGNMHERTVTVSGVSKTYSVTGWRVGWAIAEAELTEAVRKVHDYLTIGAPTPLQEALVTALNFPREFYEKLAETYDRKRQFIMQALDKIGLQYHRPEGAYYILVNAPDYFKDGRRFVDRLLSNVGIAVLPGDALYHNKELGKRKARLAYCKRDDTLKEVAGRLSRFSLEQNEGAA
jgi:aspartate/methionine/tyrosine aminotransferase